MSSKKPETSNNKDANNSVSASYLVILRLAIITSDELTVVVEELLNSLSNKFAGVSSEIFAKMDEMSRRLDNLEAALQANQENGSNSSSKPQ
ncbi:heat shock factor binding protein 1-domain-containing protein [Biscogniauxia sp. FL1348]|nr:heat shock factor binding protein 1-domain-containing protein [Biscogniauxia sp. FL1348]